VSDILLTTLNAKYIHAAFGLRYLMANLGPALASRATLLEFDINQRVVDVLERILEESPKIVGIGVYIWNAEPVEKLVAMLKRVRPEVVVVLGGPEVSYETDEQTMCALADYVITGEADLAFTDLCGKLLAGERPLVRVIGAGLPEFGKEGSGPAKTSALSLLNREPGPQNSLALPYHLYTDADLAHRVIYVEASRGCPFKCEFCLSSLDVPVRNVPTDQFLSAMQDLLDRGCRQFKFVDRTFNLNLGISLAILRFFLDRQTPGLFLHFEMIPDRLPEALRELIQKFPAGALQFEVGIQTLNEDVEKRISRRQDHSRMTDNLRWLRTQTGVHVHADLIVGLPGENLASFGRGFDELIALDPQEIQVGMLKRLRGTPIVRHDTEWGMVYSPHPPYEILRTNHVDFDEMQRMRRFSRYWDLIANSGNFVETVPLIWEPGRAEIPVQEASPFASFLKLSDWLHARAGKRTHGIALPDLTLFLFEFLTQHQHLDARHVATTVQSDYARLGRRDVPDALRVWLANRDIATVKPTGPARQARHRV